MKNIFAVAAIAVMTLVTPVAASTLTGEVSLGDPNGGKHVQSRQFMSEYDGTVGTHVNTGLEFDSTQYGHAGATNTNLVAKAGPVLPVIFGFHSTAEGELGRSFSSGKDYNLWGFDATTAHKLVGPVSVFGEYRFRQGFDRSNLREDRETGGLSYTLNDTNLVYVDYYNSVDKGLPSTGAIGLGLKHQF